MATAVLDTESRIGGVRRPYFSAIRWTAVLGGLAAGMGSYLLLALLGVAMGLTAVDAQGSESATGVPIGMGIWTGLITIVSAFIGAYVAARMSGLARASDGMLHGFVSWGATILLFAYLTTTAVSSVLGGTMALFGQAIQGAAGTAAQVTGAQGADGIGTQLRGLITGNESGDIAPADIQAVQQRLQANDRQGAVDYMVNQMNVTAERANQIADMAAPLIGGQAEQRIEQGAEAAMDTLVSASWWLFIGLAISLAVALYAGRLGVKAFANRTLGNHEGRRRTVPA